MKYLLLSFLFCVAVTGCNETTPVAGTGTGGQKLTGAHVNLAWSATAGAQTGFYVEQSVDGTNYTQILTLPDGSNSARILVLSTGTYYFRIRSFNSAGTSPYTPVVTATL